MTDRARPVSAVVLGAVVTAGGLVLAIAGLAWAAWSPVLVFAASLWLSHRDQDSPWGRGLAVGLGLLVGAGVCSNVML